MEQHRHDARSCWWDHRDCVWVCGPASPTVLPAAAVALARKVTAPAAAPA